MRNYQKLYYQHYYIMTPDGIETETTRRECFAPPEDPTSNCPYVQRWWYDPEASYAIRLPRSPLGETLGKRNATDRKKQERTDANAAEHRQASRTNTGLSIMRNVLSSAFPAAR